MNEESTRTSFLELPYLGMFKGYTQTPNIFSQLELSLAERAFLDLLNRYDDLKKMRLSISFIAKGAGISKSQAQRAKKRLMKLGFIKMYELSKNSSPLIHINWEAISAYICAEEIQKKVQKQSIDDLDYLFENYVKQERDRLPVCDEKLKNIRPSKEPEVHQKIIKAAELIGFVNSKNQVKAYELRKSTKPAFLLNP